MLYRPCTEPKKGHLCRSSTYVASVLVYCSAAPQLVYAVTIVWVASRASVCRRQQPRSCSVRVLPVRTCQQPVRTRGAIVDTSYQMLQKICLQLFIHIAMIHCQGTTFPPCDNRLGACFRWLKSNRCSFSAAETGLGGLLASRCLRRKLFAAIPSSATYSQVGLLCHRPAKGERYNCSSGTTAAGSPLHSTNFPSILETRCLHPHCSIKPTTSSANIVVLSFQVQDGDRILCGAAEHPEP